MLNALKYHFFSLFLFLIHYIKPDLFLRLNCPFSVFSVAERMNQNKACISVRMKDFSNTTLAESIEFTRSLWRGS